MYRIMSVWYFKYILHVSSQKYIYFPSVFMQLCIHMRIKKYNFLNFMFFANFLSKSVSSFVQAAVTSKTLKAGCTGSVTTEAFSPYWCWKWGHADAGFC